MDVILELP